MTNCSIGSERDGEFDLKCYYFSIIILFFVHFTHAVESWSRRYATSPKVAGSVPNEVIGFFN
jgi:hypothetical protein